MKFNEKNTAVTLFRKSGVNSSLYISCRSLEFYINVYELILFDITVISCSRLSHFVLCYFISSHLISSHLTFYFVSTYLILFHPQLTFFQFKVITDGGTTYYSSEGGTMHRYTNLLTIIRVEFCILFLTLGKV